MQILVMQFGLVVKYEDEVGHRFSTINQIWKKEHAGHQCHGNFHHESWHMWSPDLGAIEKCQLSLRGWLYSASMLWHKIPGDESSAEPCTGDDAEPIAANDDDLDLPPGLEGQLI